MRLIRPQPLLRRFEVAERSMAPALQPGDYLLATGGEPRPGEVVAFEHPHRPGFWLVKRVASIDGGSAWVLSDDRDATRADSRSFGPVPVAGLWRVVLRYWPPSRIGRITPPDGLRSG